MTATTTERKFVLVLASRSVQRQAEELGIDQPEIQVTDSIHAGRKRRGRCTPARFPRAVFAFPQNAARAAF